MKLTYGSTRLINAGMLLALFMIFPGICCGQGLGSIVGTITDPSGAVVPAATITVINPATGFTRHAGSNAQGYFVIPSLPPAQYDLTVRATGFVNFEQKGITLLADQSVTVKAELVLARTTQQVTVHSAATLVNTETMSLNQVVDQRRIVDLPLNGRNAASLMLLVGGAVNAPSGGSDQGIYKTLPVAVTASINGSRANQTNFMLDGGNNNDNYTNVNQPFPFPDALQEFSVETSDYSAKYGGNAGAVVNIITKSGTNQLHGDGFEFVRNAVFNARNFFASSRDQLKRNQFGGTVGGPVVIPGVYNGHDRTFFFVGYQGTRISNVANGLSAFVPTPANLNGDFSALLSAANPNNPFGKVVQIDNPATGQPYLNNQIPVTSYDPAANRQSGPRRIE